MRALGVWTGSRLGLLLVSLMAVPWLVGGRDYLSRWKQWDASLFVTIAQYGYRGDPAQARDPGLPAFFPGMPAVLRLVHLVVDDWALCGLLISLVAGGAAAVALARLAEFEGGSGELAVVAMVLFPTAVFLAAGYSESLFLAFAIPAWLAARRRQWPLAVLLAAGASSIRITGLFLAVALIVEFAFSRPHKRDLPWLVIPFVPLIAYSWYLRGLTGDWLAWKHAQEAGWGRELVWPWRALADDVGLGDDRGGVRRRLQDGDRGGGGGRRRPGLAAGHAQVERVRLLRAAGGRAADLGLLPVRAALAAAVVPAVGADRQAARSMDHRVRPASRPADGAERPALPHRRLGRLRSLPTFAAK
ncbi:mannosyltransferase family protein [Nonomuraea dietziae]|uniref:Integral membrane protein n=1 Tax=Nonomuraea dietziae TaxID=65515 RepID=A0A7W5V9J4_9ACTN|nr:mannosyltransferase family protein [Nonomuraea dietziae]MBB3729650.1 hypothetical protein [Nonomuraea dietziae]